LNKIISKKNTSVLFLATLLVLGTIATISPSFMVGAQAVPQYGMEREYGSYEQPEYGMDSYEKPSYRNDYDEQAEYPSYGKDNNNYKSKKDSVSINKLNCINNNVNINGNNTGNINVGNKGAAEGYVDGYSYGGSGYGDGGYYNDGYDNKRDKGFDCIINNNNTNNNIAGSGNQTTAKATLNVTKIVTCTYLIGGLTPETACGLIEEDITENQFLIEVTDDNPVPSQFPGSESGTVVTLGAGNYVVSETFNAASLEAELELIEAELKRLAGGGGVRDYEITGPIVSFTGDCTAVNLGSEATGTIAAGESQTCEIENHFDIGLAPLMDEICNNQIDDDGDGLVDAADPDCSPPLPEICNNQIDDDGDGLVDFADPDCSPPGGLTASDINTDTSSSSNINTAGGLASSFSSQPTIAQGTEDSPELTAMEKITKLKQQWMELTP
jgi:hypothetical protein